MRLLKFFSRLFKRKSVSTGPASESARRNFSLRPDPETYLDQRSESKTVLNRIHNSSSSVIGIAGVRGAGKSSLALKILDSSAKSGYFTLLIHSPTGYEPREFLLSVFQRICEDTIEKLERLFGREQTVEARGRAELRRSRVTLWLLLSGALVVFVVPLTYSYYKYVNIEKERAESFRQILEKRTKERTTELQTNLTAITASLALLEKCLPLPEACRNLSTQNVVLSESRKATLREFVEKLSDAPLRTLHELLTNRSTRVYQLVFHNDSKIRALFDKPIVLSEDDVKYIASSEPPDKLRLLHDYMRSYSIWTENELEEYRGDDASSWLRSEADRSGDYLWQLFPVLAIGALGYGAGLGIFLAVRKVQLRINLQSKYPRQTGLYQLAKATLEHLKYQTTMTSSQDASVSIWKLATKFVRTKQLETRPVSMPGLTADCNEFIDNVAEVFGGKSVICLDELDKIIDPKQLEELLTGVKGILGQNRSHFILTVSEDALARFATRRRTERDIIESSFDEIISLNRVTFQVARHIVCKMVAVNESNGVSDRMNKNILLAWIFGGGIPREIKRTVVTAADAFDFVTGDPNELWQILFSNLRDSLKSWALIASTDEDSSYDFLVCLENVECLRSPDQDPTGWYRDLIALWSKYYKLPFVELEAESKTNGEQPKSGTVPNNRPAKFERAIFEVMIGAYALLLVADDEAKFEELPTDRLLDVFTLFVYSPSFAAFKFHRLLNAAGIIWRQGDAALD